jgi:hypothetical protein
VGHLNFRGLPQRQASSHPLASPRPLPSLAPQREVFWLRNLSAEQPLELSLRVEGLAQLAEVRVEPSSLQLAPSAEAQVHVQLTPLVVRHEASDDAEALRVVVSDVDALACSQALVRAGSGRTLTLILTLILTLTLTLTLALTPTLTLALALALALSRRSRSR